MTWWDSPTSGSGQGTRPKVESRSGDGQPKAAEHLGALHDGGVVVQDDRIVAASCLFPLSQSPDVDKRLGTRHRAALGLSEETDALVVVVSEETGRVSTASGGKLHHDLSG